MDPKWISCLVLDCYEADGFVEEILFSQKHTLKTTLTLFSYKEKQASRTCPDVQMSGEELLDLPDKMSREGKMSDEGTSVRRREPEMSGEKHQVCQTFCLVSNKNFWEAWKRLTNTTIIP